MSAELVLYTNPMSRGRIARWMIEEVGAPYRTETLDYGTTMKGADYLAINPMGKVPAIRHGDTVVTECAAICAYLADAFPEAGLAPAPTERGDYYRWLFFAAGPLEAAIMDRTLGVEVPDDKKMMAGYGCYDDAVNALEQAVTGRQFIARDRFSAADVYVGSHIMWGTQFGTLPKKPAFETYIAGLSTRPAFIRASALDDAAMPAQPAPAEPA
ncbi:glutathione S-transferase family protein [Sphingomonas sp. LaA6.9]|uniref:glutathione S-transferase family protein n=1 Tax=Sphingomonas sp. LaA6.9 TaxID=2919914 RepID=UPI001F501968|nr:glutathione S-transferase family protein [Sphingomonas sp. LaA6.9]MCJ8157189.1 glutathione S-transferase family protein [Sphingomonas sp. LaA6.9]